MVHDFGAPGQHLVPFVFDEPKFMIDHNIKGKRKADKKIIYKYEPYFCFINLEKIKDFIDNPEQIDKSNESSWLIKNKIDFLTNSSLLVD